MTASRTTVLDPLQTELTQQRLARRSQRLAAVNRELRARNRQQSAVAALGQHAIRDRDLASLMAEAAAMLAATLGTPFTAIGELVHGDHAFRLRAGVGWKTGVVGRTMPAQGTPAAYLLRTGKPLVIADTASETRFPIPAGMQEHGVVSAIYVIIRCRERPWGNLSAYTARPRVFTADDVDFALSVANILALAIERHEAEVAQRQEQEILQAVFDNIPVMVSFYSPEGRLLRANQAWQRTLGWTVAEAQQVDVVAEAYPDPEAQSAAREFIRRSDRSWADFRMRTRNGRMLEASWARFLLSDGSRIGFGLDLTERRRAEAALAASEARFATLFHASPVALSMSTLAEGRILAVNQSWLELLGYSMQEVVGRTNRELGLSVDQDLRDATMEDVRRLGEVRSVEMAVRRKAGDVRDVLASVVLVQLDGQPECAISALTDITARKRAEAERDRLIEQSQAAHERLGALSRRLLMVQEEERRRLAIELHDELGQLLTAVKINLESLARSAAGASPAQLEGAIGSVDHAMLRMRELALDLRPSVLDDLGLPPALRWYADRFARHSGIEAHVSIDAVPGLEPGVATACFRVVQEALTNVARHARARRVWVELRFDGLGLELSVRDDGCGFDVAAARTRALQGVSMGLLGMQERVTLAGGHFDLRAEPGVGTVLRACFPLSPQSGGPA